MKKTYLSPLTLLVSIETQKFIAQSPQSSLTGQEDNDNPNVKLTEDEEYGGEGCSRRRDVWDDED